MSSFDCFSSCRPISSCEGTLWGGEAGYEKPRGCEEFGNEGDCCANEETYRGAGKLV